MLQQLLCQLCTLCLLLASAAAQCAPGYALAANQLYDLPDNTRTYSSRLIPSLTSVLMQPLSTFGWYPTSSDPNPSMTMDLGEEKTVLGVFTAGYLSSNPMWVSEYTVYVSSDPVAGWQQMDSSRTNSATFTADTYNAVYNGFQVPQFARYVRISVIVNNFGTKSNLKAAALVQGACADIDEC
eukprot:2721101-Rhodomonas_salina.1